jgi:hypothetical protein
VPSDGRGGLEEARHAAGLSLPDLWIRYIALGGMKDVIEVDAYLHGLLTPTGHERDVLAHALNERFSELGRDHPVPYS